MAAAGQRRDDDEVRVAGKSAQPLFLLKLPASLARNEAWAAEFAESGRIVGTLSGPLETGAMLAIDAGGKAMNFTVSLKDNHVKSRIVSTDVGEDGSNPRFEGIVVKTGTLNPPSLKDVAYLNTLRQSVREDATRTKVVQTLKQKDLDQMAAAASAPAGAPKRPHSEDEEESDGDADGGGGDDDKAQSSKTLQPKAKKRKVELTPDEIRRRIFDCFSRVDPETKQRRAFWKRGDLRKTTQVPLHKLGPVLDEVCVYHEKGAHNKYYSLKPEFNII